ncbi:hypothetical protein FHR70_002581 [Microvirga lupini]|uniref:Uncharacterized protein n=1 Tax=Microvirga lupini TaxID=420324 RepID=A0A7W4VMD2_9HYPH|nr:hypothetical protein [Microvirga lupini]MBB3019516.1 hypothetical protein [Microvirga lupini]
MEVVWKMLPPVRISDDNVERSVSNERAGLLDRRSRRLAGDRYRPIQSLSRHNEEHSLSPWLIMSAGEAIRDPMTNLF